MKTRSFFRLCLLSFFAFSCEQLPKADVIVIAENIWTGNAEIEFATALAIKADTILAVGQRNDILKLRGKGTVIKEYAGGFIVPGFIDTHTHFMDGGYNLASVQLRDANTPDQFREKLQRYAATLDSGIWILGGDWDHENWGGELPDRSWIDGVTPNNPVFISRLDGHMALVNSLALKLANVPPDQADVSGGTIVRDQSGRMTGIFKDNAMSLFNEAIPSPTAEQERQALDTAMRYVASRGVTSVHHLNGSNNAIEEAARINQLITRIYVVGALPEWQEVKAEADKAGESKWLKYGGVKGFVDGSLGSHTAAFFEAFSDSPADSGFFINEEAKLYEWIKNADAAGLQVMVHAIGDKANHTLLNIFERVSRENGPKDRRFRIEHAQHISPPDIPRFAQLGVIASMQPYHAIDDGRWAERVIGPERIKTTYAFKSLLSANAKVVFGSDWFVAPPTPLEGIYAAVTRHTLDGKNPDGWVPEQRITVEQALKAYTVDAAYASFEEEIKGSLSPGKLADFVVLGENLIIIQPEKIKEVKVRATYTGGEIVYEAH